MFSVQICNIDYFIITIDTGISYSESDCNYCSVIVYLYYIYLFVAWSIIVLVCICVGEGLWVRQV